MSKLDVIKEQIGWLKVVFGALVAAALSVLAWLVQNVDVVVWYKTVFVAVALIVLGVFIYKINQKAQRAIKRLEKL